MGLVDPDGEDEGEEAVAGAGDGRGGAVELGRGQGIHLEMGRSRQRGYPLEVGELRDAEDGILGGCQASDDQGDKNRLPLSCPGLRWL